MKLISTYLPFSLKKQPLKKPRAPQALWSLWVPSPRPSCSVTPSGCFSLLCLGGLCRQTHPTSCLLVVPTPVPCRTLRGLQGQRVRGELSVRRGPALSPVVPQGRWPWLTSGHLSLGLFPHSVSSSPVLDTDPVLFVSLSAVFQLLTSLFQFTWLNSSPVF